MNSTAQEIAKNAEAGRRPSVAVDEQNGEAPVMVKALRKSFGEQVVLNGINLSVARGETVAVLGRSGTGKSVLLKIIIGLEKPDGGSVQIHGQEIAGLPLEKLNGIRRKMGFLFQQAALYDSLTVEENVAFPLLHNTQMPRAEQRDRAEELLKKVGMESDLQKMPSDISGGMQKRVGLARALALDPDILLLDEPTAGLDPITSGQIDELILKLQEERQMASIVVTHDLQSAKTIAGRLALLDQGNIVIAGKFEDLEKSHIEFVTEFMKRDS